MSKAPLPLSLALASIAGACLVLGSAPAQAELARIRDIAEVRGMRQNTLFGYGLVVGLQGTGDTERVLFTQQSISGMLGRLGVRVDPKQVRSRNVAAVMVTANLQTYTRAGAKIDVSVSSMGDARSLAGGVLIVTPLLGGDGKVYAVAQGSVQTSGILVEASGSSIQKNATTSGRIPDGGLVEAGISPNIEGGPLVLSLKEPDALVAQRLVDAVNATLGDGRATAIDPGTIEVAKGDDTTLSVLAKVERVEVEIEGKARIVVSERTGTVVAGDGVRIRPVVVAFGKLQVSVGRDKAVVQPMPFGKGETATVDNARVDITEDRGAAKAIPATTTVDELVAAVNAIGATPRDLIAILQALKAAGALNAEIVVM